MKICAICKGDPQSIDNFNKNSSRKDGRQSHCRECGKKHAKGYYKVNKSKMVTQIVVRKKERVAVNRKRLTEYLLERACVDCGESDVVVLDFDHVRGKKLDNVTHMLSHSWDNIQKEMEKCEIRCANCHRIKTAKERGYYRAM